MTAAAMILLIGTAIGSALTGGASVTLAQGSPTAPWVAPERAAKKTSPMPDDKAAILAGKSVYAANCLACHGVAGKGDGPAAIALNARPKDLADPKSMDQTDGALFWKVTEGRAPMPIYKQQLTDDQRWQVVHYIRTLGPTPPRFDAPESLRTAISGVLKAYAPVQQALAKADGAAAAKAVPTLIEAVARLRGTDAGQPEEAGKQSWQENLESVASATNSLKEAGADPAKLRDSFRKASEALTAMIGAFGHTEATTVRLFVGPAGKTPEPLVWLQVESVPLNPYADATAADPGTLQRQLGSRRTQNAAPQAKAP